MWRLAVAALVVSAIGMTFADSGADGAGMSLSSRRPATIMELAGMAMEAAGSFHSVLTTRIPGLPPIVLSTDSATDYGTQSQSFPGGADTIRVIGRSVFLYANRIAYQQNFAVKSPKFADEWVSIPSSNKSYVSIAIDILTPSVVLQIVRATRLKDLGEVQVDGRSAVVIQGSVSPSPAELAGTLTLYVSATAPHLPLKEVQRDTVQGGVVTNTTVFSKWGERFKVSEPARFVHASRNAQV